jgi:hypothetical protein
MDSANRVANWVAAGVDCFRAAASRQNGPPVQHQRQLSQLQQDIRSSWRWFLHRPHGLTGHSLKWFQSDADLSAIAAVALLTAASIMPRSYSPSTERRAAGTVIGHWKNFRSVAGTNDPIFCAASSSMRRLGAPIASPFRPNGVMIRTQGTKAPVKTLEA